MRGLAILAVLAAGAPLAQARPHEEVPAEVTQPHHDTPMGRTSYTHADPPAPADGWTQLATPTPARYGREFIEVGPNVGPLDRLKIAASDGDVHVDHVEVFFTNGTHQDIAVKRTLAPKQHAELALQDAGQIDHLVVVTSRHSEGDYEIYGSSGAPVASR